MDSEALRPYIDWYKAHFAIIFIEREGYKWESIKTFQSLYSAEKSDYATTLKEAFSKSKNLLNSRNVFSLGMLRDVINHSVEHPEISPSGIDLFYNLFEGFSENKTNEYVLNTISSFRRGIWWYVRKYMGDKKNDYQDLHAVSVYLSHRYPDKFDIYRTREFTQFNKLLNNEFHFEWGSDANYISYLNMCDQINAILRQELNIDSGFKYIVDKLITDNDKCYNDPEYRLLTQDFIYSVVTYYKTDLSNRYKKQVKKVTKVPVVEFCSVDQMASSRALELSQGKNSAHTDYVERQMVNSQLGNAGEEWVYEYEKKYLMSIGRADLAKRVEWVAKYDDSKGFDILSYDKNGNEIFIEVKTTNGGSKTPFYISALEMEVNKIFTSKYRLYRLYDFAKEPKLRIIMGDLSKLYPQATNYIVYVI